MDGIVPYFIWAVLIMTGASVIAIVIFGLRALTFGTMDPVTLTLLAVPIVLFVILGFVMDSWAEAAVMTVLIEIVVTSLSLLMSSIRGLVNT